MSYAIYAISAGNFAIGLGAYLMVGLLVPLAQDMQVSMAVAGLVMFVYAGCYALASPIISNFSGHWPQRSMLLGSLALMSLGTLLCILTQDWYLLLVGRALSALGGAAYTPIASSAVYNLSPRERRGRNLALMFLGISLAQAVGIPVAIWLETLIGWRLVMLAATSLAVIAMIAICLTAPRERGPLKPTVSYRLLFNNRLVLVSLLLSILNVTSYNVVYTYLSPLALSSYHINPMLLLLVIGLSNASGAFLVGEVVDRLGPRKVLIYVLCGFVLLLPVFSIMSLPVPVILAVALVWGFLSGLFMVPQQMSLLRDAQDHQTLVLALNATAIYIGVALGSGIGALVVNWAGLEWLGLVASGISVLGLIVLLRHPNRLHH